MCLAATDSIYTDLVDILDVNRRSWSSARLSETRSSFASASFPDIGIALFAGGSSKSKYCDSERSMTCLVINIIVWHCCHVLKMQNVSCDTQREMKKLKLATQLV
jgi:hypothetical protein